MFENERRPLYKLCKKLPLTRISQDHYYKHLNYAAQAAWKNNLAIDVFDEIMLLTERHPYYVNALCDEIWASNDKLPAREKVNESWEIIIENERSDLRKTFWACQTTKGKFSFALQLMVARRFSLANQQKKWTFLQGQ